MDCFGRLDILINNAGIFPQCPALDVSGAQWDEVIETNLKGAFIYAQAAARTMIAGGRGGKIVNIASNTAFRPDPNNTPYAVSKGGMVSLTKALAVEFAFHKILVNAIAPGNITTPGADAAIPGISADVQQLKKLVAARTLLGEFGRPDDIANAVLFLVSAAADYVTGSVILVDGGELLT